MTIQEEVIKVLTQARDEIRANMAANNINASGRTSASIDVRQEGGTITLGSQGEHVAPLYTLEIGRPGGNVPGGFRTTKAGVVDVSNTFKWILIQWAKEKGFELNWGGATMLGRRIAQQGTNRYMSPVDVYSTPTTKAVGELRSVIRKNVITTITQVIKTNF